MKTYLVTGAAGFIGFHVARRILDSGGAVVGYDNLGDYYDVSLKEDRLALLAGYPAFRFHRADLVDAETLTRVFGETAFDVVIHLAAQAGVRYSLENPRAYIGANVAGFLNVLECCRNRKTPHLVYASSSSVYGLNSKIPFHESDAVDHPVSLYAATKKSNELMAHTYSHLFELPTTGLRFFTVYGPWGRPDMAVFKFTKAILEGKPIDVYNHGKMRRDFTYVDDIVEGVLRIADRIPQRNENDANTSPESGRAPFRIYNIGNNRPVELTRLIETIETALDVKAALHPMPMQPGDVTETYADIDRLHEAAGFTPRTRLEDGIERFVQWYKEYYRT